MTPIKFDKKKNSFRNDKKKNLKKNKDSDDEGDIIDLDDDSEYESDEESDSSYLPSPKEDKKKGKKGKKAEVSESDEESIDSEDTETDEDDDEEDDEKMSPLELKKTLARIFPSKYANEKVHLQKLIDKENKEKEKNNANKSNKKNDQNKSSKSTNKKKDQNKSSKSTNKKYKKEESSEEEDEYDDDAEDEDDDDEEEEDYDEEDEKKINIVFTIGGGDEDEWEDYDEDDLDESSDDIEEYNSDDEKTYMKENYKEIEMPAELNTKTDEKKAKPDKNSKKSKSDKKKDKKKEEDEEDQIDDVEPEYLELQELKKHLTEKLHKKPNSKILLNAIEECKETIYKMIKDARKKNTKNYHKLVTSDRKKTNEMDYFKNKLSNKEQLQVMKDLKEINSHVNIEKPYRLSLLESKMPAKFKAIALQKLNALRSMEPGDSEYYKIKNWVDTFMKIPFGIEKSLSVNMSDGIEKCHDFMENAKNILDNCVYGLDDAKMQIMQMVGQWISNPGAMGTAIAIKGPMGTGKCHGIDTPILMYDGSQKMVQDIEIGDLVMGDDSTPRKVLSLGRGEDDMYDILSYKGDNYSVNSEHILCLKVSGLNIVRTKKSVEGNIRYKTSYFNPYTYKMQYNTFDEENAAEIYLENLIAQQKSDIIEISVKDYLKLPKSVREALKGYMTGVEFESKEVLLDPYILGVWLGDGGSSKSMITNQDAVILSYLRNELKKENLNLSYVDNYDYNIVSDEENRPYPGISHKTGLKYENKNKFTKSLLHYNLYNNKHIPNEYKINDRNTRLQVLAGLLDTDGYYDIRANNFEITQKSNKLAEDIVFLSRSLGYSANIRKCEKSCTYKNEVKAGIYNRIIIYGENIEEIPTKCLRKKARRTTRQKNAQVCGIKVIPRGRGNYYGFELDNNHRYVLGNFIVTHNTSLIKDGISKIFGREFTFIALGGAGDSSFLEGHSYTYEGSSWGKIVQILIDSKCMNPIIYFDELDKVSDTPKGEEIIGILTHLTDTTQNNQFHDKYFSEVDFDISKCLFIFSYNDESKVNPILRDRMYRIQTKGYDAKDKTIIARKYLLPKIREQVNFKEEDVIIPDDTIQYIASNSALTNSEAGVRNLKRCLEIIHTKLNLFRLIKPGEKLFDKDMDIKVEFPFTVTRQHVDIFIKNEEKQNQSLLAMYV